MAKRGGRKPGEWTLTTPEKIVEFRSKNNVSRARLAAALGVSSTSVQNWETGLVVATRKAQAKLVEVMANPSVVPGSLRAPVAGSGHMHHASTCEATGKIVSAWLAIHPETPPDKVAELIRGVRQALA